MLSPQAEKYVRRDAPVEVRRMAATGALPLGPVELATVLFALLHDPDLEVKTRARESLEKLPDSVASTLLSAPDAHPALLGWLAEAWRDRAHRMELLALNPAADDRTYVFLAASPTAAWWTWSRTTRPACCGTRRSWTRSATTR